ncbi:MAG: tRNA (guanosine(37)-N1)-methyltransferase TrmD [Verrucomicrobiota bacterium]|nr:tRNA (guanosine(37)-N1)-methyltransferase TrmD [Verrucomicrobiota bacterium]
MPASLTIDLLTLFPGMISGFLSESIVGRAQERGLIDVRTHNIRDWATDKHQVTDDRPFGGGAGMVMKPEPLFAAVRQLETEQSLVIYLTPDGAKLTTALARELSKHSHLILISGHYEGVDQRVRDSLVNLEISIGDYVLTNGTLPGAVLVDAVCRFIPGVLGEEQSLAQDSFSDGLLGHPQWTRPVEFEGMTVPDVLLSGHHAEIEKWRLEQRHEKTRIRRPDLLAPQASN